MSQKTTPKRTDRREPVTSATVGAVVDIFDFANFVQLDSQKASTLVSHAGLLRRNLPNDKRTRKFGAQ
jgi:hypothetical protein